MSKLITKIILAVFFLLLLSFRTNADEGWWSRSRIAGGAPYSQVEHPTIALEKEVLIYKGDGKCAAHFLFRNIAEDQITVDVGFPIKVTMPLNDSCTIDPDDFTSKALLQKVYGEKLIREESFISEDDFLRITRLDTENVNLNIRKVISWNEFEAIWGSGNGWVKNLIVTQDDQSVAIDSVFVEGQVLQGDTLDIYFHFLHQLSFESNQFSTVTVRYSSFSIVFSSGNPLFTDYINWRYVLGTGRTWKGPIKTFYILVPDFLSPNLPESFAHAGGIKSKTLYLATNYEPLLRDEVRVTYVRFGQAAFGSHDVVVIGELMGKPDSANIIRSIPKPKTPAQDFVVVRNASSFLPQRTWVNSFLIAPISRNDPFWSYIFYPSRFFTAFYDPPESHELQYVVEGIPATCQNIDFSPLSLFDGLPESAWCEGVRGAGIDEWVEFELKEEVLGLAAFNGFKKVSWCWCVDTTKYKKLKSIYGQNNRVKVLEIISLNGEIKHTIELKDTPGRQNFDTIFLPKGVYRLIVREVYNGTKWDDTCLGEIKFYLATAKELVEADQFLKDAL